MKVIEVIDKRTQKQFLKVPKILYRDDPIWIQPLDKDINSVFDKKQNKYFRHGEAIRWILKDDNGQLMGRVAAFINKKTLNANDQPTGGLGFFECINDKDASRILFNRAEQWLSVNGMEAMDGPINFGERDRWWGCLVDGFIESNYCMPYNFKYYKDLFEGYGFKEYFKQYTYGRLINIPLPPKFEEKAKRIAQNPSYTFNKLNIKNIQKYAYDFIEIYNKSWGKHPGFKPMAKEQGMSIMKKMKPILDPDIVWYAYFNNRPAGFFIMIPELNQIIKHLNGKLDLIGKLKFLWYKKTGACKKMFGVIFGITPEHQGKGLEGAMVMAVANHIQSLNRYKTLEMNWIGDFNPKMMHISESVGAKIVKTHVTFRKLFDESKPFKRMPIIK